MGIQFSIDDLPKTLSSKKEKTKFIKEQIKDAINNFNATGKASTELEVRIGSLFNVLKQVVKKKKKEWEKYFAEKFPHLSIRTVQRYMKLAKNINFDKYPKLSFAGQTRLLSLLRCVPKKKEVGELIKKHKIDLDFEINKPQAVDEFRKQIDQLIKKEKPSNRGSKVSVSASLGRINQIAEKHKDILKLARNDDDLLDPVKPDLVKKAIEGIELLLEHLKAIKKRVALKGAGRDTD